MKEEFFTLYKGIKKYEKEEMGNNIFIKLLGGLGSGIAPIAVKSPQQQKHKRQGEADYERRSE